jgi:hypothetical protein
MFMPLKRKAEIDKSSGKKAARFRPLTESRALSIAFA